MKYLDLDLLENPYGRRVGGGYDTVRVGHGGRLHVKGRDGGPLCMQGRVQTDLRDSEGRVVDCYRCIKLIAMNANAPLVGRDLTTSRGEKRKHLMVPGGRQGRFVAEKKLSPYAESGASPFKRGPSNHPTQPWMTKRLAMAKTREERVSAEGIALPANYLPQSVEEHEEYVAGLLSDVSRAKRRMAAKRGRAGKVAAAAAAEAAEMERLAGYANNPGRSRAAKAAVSLDAEMRRIARYIHTSGQARSLEEAYRKLRAQNSRLVDEGGEKILYFVDYNPRTRRTELSWASPSEMHYANIKAGMYNNPRNRRSKTRKGRR